MQNEKFCMVFAWLSANLLLFDKSRALIHSHAPRRDEPLRISRRPKVSQRSDGASLKARGARRQK
jgi:hypothetical protein